MSDDRFSIDDNIVLDPKTAKTNNIKKILTGIAILVVLFLIVLIISRDKIRTCKFRSKSIWYAFIKARSIL